MFDMGFLNKYPYTDFHELNLDWVIRALKEYAARLETFVQINAIKYADPIQWDITRQYEKNTIVIDPLTGTAYISVAAVPSGIALSRPKYWTVIFDLSRFINAANDNFTVRVETNTTTTATFNTAADEWLVWDQKLYRANVNITAGDAYVEGSNITRITVEEMLQEVQTALDALTTVVGDLADLTTTDKSSIVNAINDVVSALTTVVNNIGALASLNTADKSSIVNAINEVLTDISGIVGIIGDLADLTTTDKSSIVNAINELVSALGALSGTVGTLANLNTTDKSSIVNAINEVVSTIGDLANLNTTDKSSIVNAINEMVSNLGVSIFLTPEQFGAVGDGVTDDGPAIQAAMDALPASGGAIYFSDKTYVCGSNLTISVSNICFRGMSRDTSRIKFTGSGSMLDGSGTYNTEISNMNISCDAGAMSVYQPGTKLIDSRGNIRVHDCEFNRWEYVIEWHNGYYNYFENSLFQYSKFGLYNITQYNTTLVKCAFRHVETAIAVGGGFGPLSMFGCSFEELASRAVVGRNSTPIDAIFNGCYFECTTDPVDDGFTSLDGTYGSSSIVYTAGATESTIVITGCTFIGAFYRIVYKDVAPSVPLNVISKGNLFSLNMSALDRCFALSSAAKVDLNDSFTPAFTGTLSDYVDTYDPDASIILDPVTDKYLSGSITYDDFTVTPGSGAVQGTPPMKCHVTIDGAGKKYLTIYGTMNCSSVGDQILGSVPAAYTPTTQQPFYGMNKSSNASISLALYNNGNIILMNNDRVNVYVNYTIMLD